jgi:hypothetical protein
MSLKGYVKLTHDTLGWIALQFLFCSYLMYIANSRHLFFVKREAHNFQAAKLIDRWTPNSVHRHPMITRQKYQQIIGPTQAGVHWFSMFLQVNTLNVNEVGLILFGQQLDSLQLITWE